MAEALEQRGLTKASGARALGDLEDLARGSFTRKVLLGGNECDIAVRLNDGRLLAIECKVSNSALNSVKRLVRETGGKAGAWNRDFGARVATAAVLAGVFKLGNLLDAQDNHHVVIYWEHNLDPLIDFVRAAAR